MEQTKIILGPVQTAWIKSLRDNPDKQGKSQLGKRNAVNGHYEACCLGQGGLIAGVCQWSPETNHLYVGVLNENDGELESSASTYSKSYLKYDSYKALGLVDYKGSPTSRPNDVAECLAYYNDLGKSWADIADMLEKNPENWFIESK
jgi:hypothetical protein